MFIDLDNTLDGHAKIIVTNVTSVSILKHVNEPKDRCSRNFVYQYIKI
ncbi:MAG: hypothetical protein LBJ68_01275 [Endomicrobium sp.]|jgi:hypothetical protein|nr:hypothetical protein [Endomicrobium sp.]